MANVDDIYNQVGLKLSETSIGARDIWDRILAELKNSDNGVNKAIETLRTLRKHHVTSCENVIKQVGG
ncbi:MAG: hypothetical protein QXS68_04855 [Candidatus Methanomethylicaceae archaeon]